MNALQALDLLGKKAKDIIEGTEGIITSVSFDLYGCVQVILHPPGTDKDGKPHERFWYDEKRIVVLEQNPVMPPPDFGQMARNRIPGPADKPAK